MPKRFLPISPPYAAIFACQKSGGKTMTCTFIADALTLNGYPFQVFQIDDQKRLSTMLGEKVIDLRPNPDLLIEDPTLLTRAITPFYEAVSASRDTKSVVLLDTGANEIENLSNFLDAVDYAEDTAAWGIPTIVFVPFLPLDPESCEQAAFTVKRLRAAAPNLRIVLVENRHGGRADRIVAGSLAERSYRELIASAKGAEQIHMPAMAREYWAPFEGAGMRFLKVLALDPEEGSRLLHRNVAEIKIMKSHVARFWREMHAQLATILVLPVGGQ